jgi:hypothetical protein
MNAKKMMAAFCAAGLVCAAFAQEAKSEAEVEEKDDGLAYTPGEGVSFGEQKLVTAEVGLAFDSKYMTYGVVDGKDPILTPSAQIKFFDWVYFGASAIYDVTKGNGKRGGYGKRTGKRSTFDATVGIAHDFDLNDTLGALSVDFNYIYEYFRRYHGDDGKSMDDTQYLNLTLSLDDLWFEPALWIERDIMADNGTYVNFEVGHTFTLVGDEDSPDLTFKPSVGQGFGNTQRARGYFTKHPGSDEALDHGGLMDTSVKGTLEWSIADWVSLSAYVAYYDYIFDANMRDGARSHNAQWGNADRYRYSWNVVAGVALTLTF